MAKPIRKRRKDARPGEILEAGLREFAKSGYAATRLEDVAKLAGISKGTIYRYFDDKEALFLAAVQSQAGPTFETIERFVANFDGPTDKLLVQLFGIIHEKMLKSDLQILMQIILTEGRKFPNLTEFYYNEGITLGQRILRQIIARGIQKGEIRESAASRFPMILIAPAIMAAVWKMTFETQETLSHDAFLEAHIDLVLHGILKEKP